MNQKITKWMVIWAFSCNFGVLVSIVVHLDGINRISSIFRPGWTFDQIDVIHHLYIVYFIMITVLTALLCGMFVSCIELLRSRIKGNEENIKI